jgi:hypothetical protein
MTAAVDTMVAAVPPDLTFTAMRPAPVFVVGMWRSGTSLLYALLNQHPQIGLMYESDFPLLAPVFLMPRKTSSWAHKIDSWNGALLRHRIDVSAIRQDITALPEAFRAVAQQYAQKKGASVWGCKSPNYYDRMDQLAEWFPQARFIVIWRDPADVCRSILAAAGKSSWFARPGMDLRALLGCGRMKQQVDELLRRGVAVHQLQFNDLVGDPAATLAAICGFLGVPYDPRMNSLAGADRSAIYNGAHHSMVKSTAIVANRDRADVLPPQFKAKIQRYIVFWRQKYAGTWPLDATVESSTPAAPFPERALDRMRHALLRAQDSLVPYAYSLVPVFLWRKYRQAKYRYKKITPPAADGNLVETEDR